MKSPIHFRSAVPGALLLASAGCQLDLDADLSKKDPPEDAGGWSCPVGYTCTPTPGGDSGVQPELDGGGLPNADAGNLPESDASQPPGCSSDSDCDEGTFCSLVSGDCLAACDAARGCVVPNTGRVEVESLRSSEQGIFWTTRSRQDAYGNYLQDGKLWRMDASGTSTELLTGFVSAGIVALVGDDLYFTNQNSPTLWRISVSNGGAAEAELLGGPVASLALSENFVWWARPHLTDWQKFELFRLPRSGGGEGEKVRDVEGYSPRIAAATDTGVLLWGTGASVTNLDYLENGSQNAEVLGATTPWSEPFFYGEDLVVGVYRLSRSGQSKSLAVDHNEAASSVRGSWLIWAMAACTTPDSCSYEPGVRDITKIRIGRSQLDLRFAPEVLADVPLVPREYMIPPTFALSPYAQELVYFHPDEQRLFRFAIPDYPCSTEVPCPSGLSCQPDQTCK